MDEFWIILIVETIAVATIGSLLHFCYEWSGKNKIVGMFAAVNESTWEHIKLALSGIFACTLVDVWFLGSNPNYWLARNLSFLVPVIVIPIIFYTYTAFTGKAVLMTDILSFIFASFLSTLTFVAMLNVPAIDEGWEVISMAISIAIIAGYLLLTRFPIRNNMLFEDPITHEYGYAAFRPLFGKNGSLAKKKKNKKSGRKK